MVNLITFNTAKRNMIRTVTDADRFAFVNLLGHTKDENPNLQHIRAMAKGISQYPDGEKPHDKLSPEMRDLLRDRRVLDSEGEMHPAYRPLAQKMIQPLDIGLNKFGLDFSDPEVERLIQSHADYAKKPTHLRHATVMTLQI